MMRIRNWILTGFAALLLCFAGGLNAQTANVRTVEGIYTRVRQISVAEYQALQSESNLSQEGVTPVVHVKGKAYLAFPDLQTCVDALIYKVQYDAELPDLDYVYVVYADPKDVESLLNIDVAKETYWIE